MLRKRSPVVSNREGHKPELREQTEILVIDKMQEVLNRHQCALCSDLEELFCLPLGLWGAPWYNVHILIAHTGCLYWLCAY